MKADAQIIAGIDAAFGKLRKPEHFTNFMHCQECREHDDLLRLRDRSTLLISDVGNICWQPISFSSPAGIAYYMPALARLALAEPTYEYGWYGDTLQLHLSSNGESNGLLQFCNQTQRQAVVQLLEHLNASRAELEERATTSEEMEATRALWANKAA